MRKIKLVLVLLSLVMVLSILPLPATAQSAINCGHNSDIETLLNQITENGVAKWIRDLSGENSVFIDGKPHFIRTRFTSELFNPSNQNAKAYPYLTQELIKLGYVPGSTLIDHEYAFNKYVPKNLDPTIPAPAPIDIEMVSAKNLVLTIPGRGPNANQQVLMTAHLDSTTNYDGDPREVAPGAEDNASGVAALMEAADLFRYYKFDRTIKMIFFTGEEQGLHGSTAYVEDFASEMSNIQGVVNLDMFGYDSDKDMCMELHVGKLSASNTVGTCFTNVINNYNLGVKVDYLINEAVRASDHAPFWDAGVGAVEILENHDEHSTSYGCKGVKDSNPHYHKRSDTIDKMYMPATHRITQTGVGTVASMAGMMGKCFNGDPRLTAKPQEESISLTWTALEGAEVYRIYRGTRTCNGEMTLLAEVTTNSYLDSDIKLGQPYFYKVQAVEPGGGCISQMSNCDVAIVPKPQEPPVYDFFQYLPLTLTAEG
jgi:leucyl aminopeptidase